jgi:hypothetical protein
MRKDDTGHIGAERTCSPHEPVAYPGILLGVQQIQSRTEDRENRDLGAVAPNSGVLEAGVILYKKFHFI